MAYKTSKRKKKTSEPWKVAATGRTLEDMVLSWPDHIFFHAASKAMPPAHAREACELFKRMK